MYWKIKARFRDEMILWGISIFWVQNMFEADSLLWRFIKFMSKFISLLSHHSCYYCFTRTLVSDILYVSTFEIFKTFSSAFLPNSVKIAESSSMHKEKMLKVWGHFMLNKANTTVECVDCKIVLPYHYNTSSIQGWMHAHTVQWWTLAPVRIQPCVKIIFSKCTKINN